ncbi:MAG: endonuclease V [Gemmatales bacterium]|nr:MAG: endonuclease V [Gemmatales bacterium]
MKISPLHSWELKPAEAIALQRTLAGQIDTRSPLTRYRYVAGADVSYNRFDNLFFAGVVVVAFPELEVVEKRSAVCRSPFPYVPGLLSFREAPGLLSAFAQLETRPDVVMFDGHGYAHPRRFGLACHMGLWLDVPTLGCAKSLLVGKHRSVGKKAGSTTPLYDAKEVIGTVVRTRFKVRPVFVSVGHRVDLASAVRLVLACCRGYRLPEPTRQAHLLVNALRRQGAC